MKKIKINLFAVVGLAIAALTMSFTMVQNFSLAGEKWFSYTDETGDGNINNYENYVLVNGNGSTPPPCEAGNDILCGIEAQPRIGDSEHPDLNTIIYSRYTRLE